jgi:predicted acylesterase/phospholipase RssA
MSKQKKILIPKKKKIALICSGGAAKAGAFHLGALLALQEKGFKFKGGLKSENQENTRLSMSDSAGREISVYVGSSAGSLICTYLAAGHSIETIIDSFIGRQKKPSSLNQKPIKPFTYKNMFSLRKEILQNSLLHSIQNISIKNFFGSFTKTTYENFFNLKWLKISGFFSTQGIEKYVREEILTDNNFSSYESDLFIVATQLNHSRKVVFGKYNYSPPSDDNSVIYLNDVSISKAVAASTALPPIYAPYSIVHENGKRLYYFDGEIRDTLSTHVGFDAGADLIISSYTHQPYHYIREIGSLHEHGLPSILVQALYLLIERRIQAARFEKERAKAALEATYDFFKQNNLPEDLAYKLIDILERKLSYKKNVDYIYIHPKASDHQMFFGDNFNLNLKTMSEYVKIGFRCTIETLHRYEFE